MFGFLQNCLNALNDLIFTKAKESTYFSNLLEEIEERTEIPAQYIISGCTAIFLFLLVLAFGPYVLCDVIAGLYPAYQTFEAIEMEDRERCKKWLMYWIVFGIVHIIGHIADVLFYSFYGYHMLKFLFLLWCFAPVENNGSIFLYENYLKPAFQHNVGTAEKVLQEMRRFTIYPGSD